MTAVADLSAASSAAAAENPPAPSGRNARGQFAPGNPGGPGRTPRVPYIERDIAVYVAQVVTPERWGEVVDAVCRKATEGNMTAVNWLSRILLSGRLSEAAIAQSVGLPTEFELHQKGTAIHHNWVQHVMRHAASGSPPAKATTDAKTADTSEGVRSAAEQPARPAPSAAHAAPAAQALRPQSAPAARQSAPGGSALSQTALSQTAAAEWMTAPAADRVRGFRVTKGPQPLENGRNRQNRANSAAAPTAAVAG